MWRNTHHSRCRMWPRWVRIQLLSYYLKRFPDARHGLFFHDRRRRRITSIVEVWYHKVSWINGLFIRMYKGSELGSESIPTDCGSDLRLETTIPTEGWISGFPLDSLNTSSGQITAISCFNRRMVWRAFARSLEMPFLQVYSLWPSVNVKSSHNSH